MSDRRKRKDAKRTAQKRAERGRRQAPFQRDDNGRTHLLVRRDGGGNVTAMGLSRPIFSEAWQNDVAVAAASTANALMSRGRTRENAVELGRNAMTATSTIAEHALSLAVDRSSACHAGCAHCCYQAVGVSPLEVLAIYEHLATTRSPAELEAVRERVRGADDRTRGMTSAERLAPDLPCPFLVEARCSIYEARPLACRGTNSLDASTCDETLHDPAARADFLAGRRSVPCFLEPIRAFHAVAAGLQLSLHELHGLSVVPLELTAAMRLVLDDPDGVTASWLRGEDPLQAAEGADNTHNPLIRELSGRLP